LSVAAACGGSSNSGPSWRNAQSGDPGARPSTHTQFLELRATSTTVSQYNDPPRSAAPTTRLSQVINSVIAEASAESGLVAPIPDGRLYRALDELAEVTPVDTPVTYSLIEFALQRNGIIEPSPHMVIIWGDMDEPEEIASQLRERLGVILASGRFRRVGIGTARRGADGDLILLAFQESHLETKPIARELPAGGSVGIEGTIAREFSEIRVFHTSDAGEVKKLEVAGIGGHGFRVRFDCEEQRGRQQVEITAADHSGSTVLANFPIWCADKAPTSMRVASSKADPPPKTREEAEERMLVLLNEDRAKHGLGPLTLDTRLTQIARLHSDDMLRSGQVAHVSPTTGSAADRVKAGKVRTAVVLENVARAYGVAEAESGLMNSPGHRANILSDEVSHVGIGITLGDDVAGRRELLVTQVFIHVPSVIDPNQIRNRAAEKIKSVRPMSSDPDLQAIAQDFASAIAGGASTKEASQKASKRLDVNRGGFSRVSTLVTTVADIASFDPSGSLGEDSVRFMGIGVAQGSHAVMGDGAIYIVVLLGER
jgi:uncharacterized protein YkwD